ncbi:hypothetical protein [Kitasatospora sp. NPDC090091]|uniref:hypothetical protein n=1 Tax=Kitasatospora sp. NPDC090091 TaxID=3364081 RepID=UPI0037FDF7FC
MADETDSPATEGIAQAAFAEVEARQARRRWLVASVGLPVAVAVGVSLWVWKPWQSADLPESACWSTVTRADLEPAAGDDGKAVVDEKGDPAGGKQVPWCGVHWDTWHGRTLLSIGVERPDRAAFDAARLGGPAQAGQGDHPPRSLALGQGITGWIHPDASVDLLYQCDYPGHAEDHFRRVRVVGTTDSGSGVDSLRASHVGIAWRTAQKAIAGEHCQRLGLVDAPPAVPAR